jgi:hypothetical protein
MLVTFVLYGVDAFGSSSSSSSSCGRGSNGNVINAVHNQLTAELLGLCAFIADEIRLNLKRASSQDHPLYSQLTFYLRAVLLAALHHWLC